jgi:muramoyltetrapeptide carboxypeptidase
MKTLYGKFLPAGGTIGIASPASPPARYSDVLRGIAWWESHGYHVKLAEGALEISDYFAGSPESRAKDLQALFEDPQVDVIQCMRGGFGSAEIIPLLDFNLIARNPKAFLGFSDITALHCALQRFTGIATFYGPSLTSVGNPGFPEFTSKRLLALLSGETIGPIPHNPTDAFIGILAGGQASGRLIGGCLSDLIHTLGTAWEVDLDQAIFVFEEPGSSPHAIERALLHLTQAGKLKNVRGVIVGDLSGGEFDEGGGSPFPRTKNLEEVLQTRLGNLGVPVVSGFPFGHGTYFATLPLGVTASLDGDKGTLEVTEPALIQGA